MATNVELFRQITPEKLKKLKDLDVVWFIEVAEAGLRGAWKDHKDAPIIRNVVKLLKAEKARRK